MALNKSLMSSKRDSWNTPANVLELVRKVGPIALDPCSNVDSVVCAMTEWYEDGLARSWALQCEQRKGLAFINPPYGRDIGTWVERCYLESCAHTEVVALLPARPDTAWFEWAWTADALCFWRGRLRFLGAPSSAPFPSVVAYWGPRKYRFADVFSEAGKVVMP